MAGTSAVWLVCFKQNKTKDARIPLPSLCEKKKCKVKQTNLEVRSISHLGISDD